ncbi:14-3-3 domain-containing protein [Aspergillus floccosus]
MPGLAMDNANMDDGLDSVSLDLWMASSEVDQKALGNFASIMSLEKPFLSAMLYKILGLSVMLSKKLLRARRLRRLDPTRETKSLQLYHHIIWLSREGLLILEEFVLPRVEEYLELKILAYKLRASFYHVFVLFHNQPAVRSPGIISLPSDKVLNGTGSSESSHKEPRLRFSFEGSPEIITVPHKTSPPRPSQKKVTQAPPGLAPVQLPRSASSFLLPALDYTPTATACFNHAALLADRFLPGSHPLRLSIKLEYAAYLYDCLHDSTACRRLAKQAIADVYNAQEGMDDESFEDAAEIVGILGKMVKRGGKTSSAGGTSSGTLRADSEGGRSPKKTSSKDGGSTTPSGTPRGDSSRSDGGRSPVTKKAISAKATPRASPAPPVLKTTNGLTPAVPDPTMVNPI